MATKEKEGLRADNSMLAENCQCLRLVCQARDCERLKEPLAEAQTGEAGAGDAARQLRALAIAQFWGSVPGTHVAALHLYLQLQFQVIQCLLPDYMGTRHIHGTYMEENTHMHKTEKS